MAGSKTETVVQTTKAVEVPQQLQDGEKFVKWDEVKKA